MAIVAALIALGAAQPSIALPGLAKNTAAKAGSVHCKHVSAAAFSGFSHRAWRLIAWERGKPPRAIIRAQRGKLRCAKGPGHRKAMRDRWGDDQRVFFDHRDHKLEQRERLRYLPFACGGGTRSAIPCSIMWCESGGSYTARNTSSTAGGRYQVIDSTWYAYGGRPNGDSHPAAAAPKAEQDRIAAAIYADGGGSAWVCA